MRGSRALVLGGAVILLLAAGWFVLSHTVMGTKTSDALGESLGVAFGLLVFVSVLGAVKTGRGRSR